MKKFLGILAIAAVFASCDNAGSGTSAEDSAKKAQDSARVADSIRNASTPTVPTTPTITDSGMNKMGGDSSNKMNTTIGSDSTKPKM